MDAPATTVGQTAAGISTTTTSTVAALGAHGQKIYVSPANELVLSRQGGAAAETTEAQSDFDAALVTALSRARR